MPRLTVKNLWANKVRFALTTFGVTLAVSFIVSAFVLGDGLRASFEKVSEEIASGVDLEVRNVADLGDAPPLAIGTVPTVAAVEGVDKAVADIEAADNAVRPIKADGSTISTNGPPQLAFNWIEDDQLSAFRLVEGSPPRVGQFTIDVDSAAKHGFVIGHTYKVMTPKGTVELALSGTSSFGSENATLGAVLMQMNTAQAGELFAIDGVNAIKVKVASGADTAAVQARVRDAVRATAPTVEVVDNAAVLAETTSDFTQEIDIIGNILLGFGGVALFVSLFIIYNTFAIVIGQRTRELALLRTVGAGPAQIRRSVLGEALGVGVLASVIGIGTGVVMAQGLEALFGAMGAQPVAHPTILASRTVIAALVIGVGATMLAAVGPARRAATIPPVAALTGRSESVRLGSRARTASALALVGAGVLAGVGGLAGVGPAAVTVGGTAFGAIAVFLGVTLLSPLAVRGVTALFGWPLHRAAGVAGRLARNNAARNPRRTATTAAALMVGLALVSTALIVGESVKATIGTTYTQSVKADYFLTDNLREVRFPAALAAKIREAEHVTAATGLTYLEARVQGMAAGNAKKQVVGLDFAQVGALLDLGIESGGFDTRVANPVVVSTSEASAIGAKVGDVLTIELPNRSRIQTTVVGLFDNQTVVAQDYLLDNSVLDHAGVAQAPEWLAVSFADAAPPSAIDTLVAELARELPYAQVETAAQFGKRRQALVDNILTMVSIMVALAVIIALIGIANTLALSVFERTRELGLIRAVGMTRRQLRRMVRLEAALVATFGSTIGVGLGLVFGSGVVAALPASFASGISVPVSQIAVLMLVAGVAGVIAAWFPARRAGRLDVLEAIAM